MEEAPALNSKLTVHAAMISLVVNVVPTNEPPQVPFSEMMPNPSLGDTLKLKVLPEATGIGTLGETVPLAPAVGVTR